MVRQASHAHSSAVEASHIETVVKEAVGVSVGVHVKAIAVDIVDIPTIAREILVIIAGSIEACCVVALTIEAFAVAVPLVEAISAIEWLPVSIIIRLVVTTCGCVGVAVEWIARTIKSSLAVIPVLIEAFFVVSWLLVMRASEGTMRLRLLPLPTADQAKLRSATSCHVVTCFGLFDPVTTAVVTLPQPPLILRK